MATSARVADNNTIINNILGGNRTVLLGTGAVIFSFRNVLN